MKVLVIVAHPDDEVLGMGGTIKKYVKKGNKVKIAIMTSGITSRRSVNYKNSSEYNVSKKTIEKMKEQITLLQNNTKKACKILGVNDIEFFNFPDNEMDLVSNLEITKKIEKMIESFKPTIVYTHSQYDINVDHQACYYATITATRPKKNYIVKEVIAFEVPSSTEWYFPSQFTPNIFVDISKEISTKLKAIQIYKNELRNFPHPRSIKALKSISHRWGSVSGFTNAEAFYLVRKIDND